MMIQQTKQQKQLGFPVAATITAATTAGNIAWQAWGGPDKPSQKEQLFKKLKNELQYQGVVIKDMSGFPNLNEKLLTLQKLKTFVSRYGQSGIRHINKYNPNGEWQPDDAEKIISAYEPGLIPSIGITTTEASIGVVALVLSGALTYKISTKLE